MECAARRWDGYTDLLRRFLFPRLNDRCCKSATLKIVFVRLVIQLLVIKSLQSTFDRPSQPAARRLAEDDP